MTLSNKEELESLRAECASLAAQAGLQCEVHIAPQDNGASHVEFDGREYSYVVTERGVELERRRTASRDDILYWLIVDEAFAAASKYELAHRIAGQDSRRALFAKKLELLARIRIDWSEKQRRAIDAILREYPYDDASR